MSDTLTLKTKHVLIIRLGSLGDLTHCLPVSYNLKKHCPQTHITWLVRERYKELLEMSSSIDEIIEIKDINPKRTLSRISEIFRIIKVIRSRKFDIILDLHCALITNFISIVSNSPLKFGIDKRNELRLRILKCCPLPKGKEIHRINAYLSILNPLGISNQEIKYSLKIPPKNSAKTLSLLKEYGYSSKDAVIALHPGTACEIKQWEIERFAELSSILTTRYDSKLIIIYGPRERRFEQDRIIKLFSPKARFALYPSIKELAGLLERCNLLIGNDSGPIHLAAALGIPTISIFGPSNHLVSGPLGNKHKVIRKDVPCSPCYGRFSVKFKCKNKDHRKCLKLLSAEEVIKETGPIITEITSAGKRITSAK